MLLIFFVSIIIFTKVHISKQHDTVSSCIDNNPKTFLEVQDQFDILSQLRQCM